MKRENLRKFGLPLTVIVIAIAITAVLWATKPKPEEEKNEFPALSVEVFKAVVAEQLVTSKFQGEVRAKTNIELVTQVAGKVVAVSDKFTEGGQFEPGEMLLKIDDADYIVALKSAEASVASAQVDLDMELALAATNAKEWRELQNRPVSEANPLRLNKPQVDRARARLDAANAELDSARLNYDRTIISAPFAGRIQTKTAELGQFMARGASIGRVFATDAMEIRIPMSDIQVGELGLALGYSSLTDKQPLLQATVSAIFGIERYQWSGYLKSVDASIDNETRLLYATVVVDQPFRNSVEQPVPLVPGLFVDVELTSAQTMSGVQIPRTALRNGTQVYVYESDKLRLKPVSVLFTSRDMVMVRGGINSSLEGGEQVITSSVPGAYDGMPVKINDRSHAVKKAPVKEVVEDINGQASLTEETASSVSETTLSAVLLPITSVEHTTEQRYQQTGVTRTYGSTEKINIAS